MDGDEAAMAAARAKRAAAGKDADGAAERVAAAAGAAFPRPPQHHPKVVAVGLLAFAAAHAFLLLPPPAVSSPAASSPAAAAASPPRGGGLRCLDPRPLFTASCAPRSALAPSYRRRPPLLERVPRWRSCRGARLAGHFCGMLACMRRSADAFAAHGVRWRRRWSNGRRCPIRRRRSPCYGARVRRRSRRRAQPVGALGGRRNGPLGHERGASQSPHPRPGLRCQASFAARKLASLRQRRAAAAAAGLARRAAAAHGAEGRGDSAAVRPRV
mmetsp:Transcript_15534/g.46351  ORF Transcript_15534/g.46351 Transcript_15534/m.46351 type:complete len:271 (-) Transcript_15534:543-1355(-)